MIVQPLIFGSTDRGLVKGYQLLGRCDAIEDCVVQEFCRWAPSHGSLQSSTSNASSIGCFPVSDDSIAVTRTIHGGPEYSGRGGLQVITMGLIVSHHQLSTYDHNPFHVINTAMTLGHIMLPPSISSSLKSVSLPSCAIVFDESPKPQSKQWIDSTVKRLSDQERIAVVGDGSPISTARQIVDSMPRSERLSTSFATGLRPSSRRPFQLQFHFRIDQATKLQLTKQQIACLDAGSKEPILS